MYTYLSDKEVMEAIVSIRTKAFELKLGFIPNYLKGDYDSLVEEAEIRGLFVS